MPLGTFQEKCDRLLGEIDKFPVGILYCPKYPVFIVMR